MALDKVDFKNNRRRTALAVIALVAIMALLCVYFWFDPVSDGLFFPKCPVYFLTGLYCPSCGSQRAFHALLHGEFLAALRYNYFLVFGVPFFALLIISGIFKSKFARIYDFLFSMKGATIYLTVYLAWFVLRNWLNL